MRVCGGAAIALVGSLAFAAGAAAQPWPAGPPSSGFASPPGAPRGVRPQPAPKPAGPPVNPAAKRAANPAPKPAGRPAPAPLAGAYAAIPLAERIAIQSDLAWTGDYYGLANGEFGENAANAIKAWQKRIAGAETGLLTPDERQRLARTAKALQERVSWRIVEDPATGARFGAPLQLVGTSRPTASGAHWRSANGEIQIETFRQAGPDVSLARAFEQQKKEPSRRKTEYAAMRGDFFVVSGLQGLKKFYVRAHGRDNEVRGVTVLYDQATEGIMDPITIAISNAFEAFPTVAAGAFPPKRRIDYASGFLASAAGDIVTEARAAEDCRSIIAAGLGRAERVAAAGGLALLRVYGARGLVPLALASEAARAGEITLVGVADPPAQDGRGAVSVAAARLSAGEAGGLAAPAPPSGFAGAPALDAEGRVIGVVSARRPAVAAFGGGGASAAAGGAGVAGDAVSLIPLEAARALLAGEGIAPAIGLASPDAARTSVMRIICVRE